VASDIGVIELVDVAVETLKVDMLLVVEEGLVAVKRASADSDRSTRQEGQIVVVPCAVVIELLDMEVAIDEVDMLLTAAGGHVAVEPAYASSPSVRSAGQNGQIVVVPCGVVIKLVDVGVATEGDANQEDDVLLQVEPGLIGGEQGVATRRRSARERREVVVMPGAVEVELMDLGIVTIEVDVLLVVEGGLIAVDRGSARHDNWGAGERCEVVVMPGAVEVELVNVII
jgi:hypothetical protein